MGSVRRNKDPGNEPGNENAKQNKTGKNAFVGEPGGSAGSSFWLVFVAGFLCGCSAWGLGFQQSGVLWELWEERKVPCGALLPPTLVGW